MYDRKRLQGSLGILAIVSVHATIIFLILSEEPLSRALFISMLVGIGIGVGMSWWMYPQWDAINYGPTDKEIPTTPQMRKIALTFVVIAPGVFTIFFGGTPTVGIVGIGGMSMGLVFFTYVLLSLLIAPIWYGRAKERD